MLRFPHPSRRQFLQSLGAGALAWTSLRSAIAAENTTASNAFFHGNHAPNWEPIPYPIPTAANGIVPEKFVVQDDVVIPVGWQYDVLLSWGDTFGPKGREVTVGYNCDFNGLLPMKGRTNEYWLLVNFEYVSARPWGEAYEAVRGRKLKVRFDGNIRVNTAAGEETHGTSLDADAMSKPVLQEVKELAKLYLDELGVGVFHVRRLEDGRLEVVKNSPHHKRVSSYRNDNVTGEHRFAGPGAATLTPPTGTMSNCSGAVLPWGTFMTCEENIRYAVSELVTPQGEELATNVQLKAGGGLKGSEHPEYWAGLGGFLETPLDGRHFGWVASVEPNTGQLTKHTSLGRFRHENLAPRATNGQRFAGYMGNDMRGGGVYKFVSNSTIKDVSLSSTAELLNDGVLYVAHFQPPNENQLHTSGQGSWIPLRPNTPLRTPAPHHTAGGHVMLPDRRTADGGWVPVGEGSKAKQTVAQWVAAIEKYTGKSLEQSTLGDLVDVKPLQAKHPKLSEEELATYLILLDAFVMANACGGTPTARPEDLEVFPKNDSLIYIAFTDTSGGSDGSPDKRIFPNSAGENSRQYGLVMAMHDPSPESESFTWSPWLEGGEVVDRGASTVGFGLAAADNLAFDASGDIIGIGCDISTSKLNHEPDRIAHPNLGDGAGFGVFGNNTFWLGASASETIFPFMTMPNEAEVTGPIVLSDPPAVLVSVQHPGETQGATGVNGRAKEDTRQIGIRDIDGELVQQERTITLGSSWPTGRWPKPSVIVVRPS